MENRVPCVWRWRIMEQYDEMRDLFWRNSCNFLGFIALACSSVEWRGRRLTSQARSHSAKHCYTVRGLHTESCLHSATDIDQSYRTVSPAKRNTHTQASRVVGRVVAQFTARWALSASTAMADVTSPHWISALYRTSSASRVPYLKAETWTSTKRTLSRAHTSNKAINADLVKKYPPP